jgi:hypothetical protein
MTDEEILEKYCDLINTNVTKYVEEYNLETVSEQQEFAARYKRNFVKGSLQIFLFAFFIIHREATN